MIFLKFYAFSVDDLKSFNYLDEIESLEGLLKRNFDDADIFVTINDIRDQESLYNLNDNAFTILKISSFIKKNFISKKSIKANYYSKVE